MIKKNSPTSNYILNYKPLCCLFFHCYIRGDKQEYVRTEVRIFMQRINIITKFLMEQTVMEYLDCLCKWTHNANILKYKYTKANYSWGRQSTN